MYLQTSRLQYNLHEFGVSQTARSEINIQATACYSIISAHWGQSNCKPLSLMTSTRESCGSEQKSKCLHIRKGISHQFANW